MIGARVQSYQWPQPAPEEKTDRVWLVLKYHILVDYEPEGTEAALGSLKTKNRFATDYKD